MNTGRLVGAALVVWIVRVLLNYLFYGVWMTDQYAAMSESHPGLFREVIPAYIAGDLLFAVVFVILFAKVASCLGGGVKAGVVLAILVAILSPLLGNVYIFYSFTIYSAGMMVTDSIFQLVSHVVSGVLAAVIYKS
jgi:hypothetical protein